MNPILTQYVQKENRRKPSVFAGFLAGAEGLVSPAGSGAAPQWGAPSTDRSGSRDRRWTQPTGLQVPTTRTAGEPAGAPCCQDVPPNDKKQRHCKSSSAIFGRGRRTWSRLPARVLLPGGERPAPTGAGAETGSRRSATGARSPLGTRFWSGCGKKTEEEKMAEQRGLSGRGRKLRC